MYEIGQEVRYVSNAKIVNAEKIKFIESIVTHDDIQVYLTLESGKRISQAQVIPEKDYKVTYADRIHLTNDSIKVRFLDRLLFLFSNGRIKFDVSAKTQYVMGATEGEELTLTFGHKDSKSKSAMTDQIPKH